MKHRIRLMLVAFNFREEYYENLGVKDLDFEGYQNIEGQVITFKEAVPGDCLALVSMSLMLYSTVNQTNESVLLNSKEFSPCAIIGTFQSEKPSDYPTKEVDTQPSNYPGREERIKEMFYKGNLLMLGMDTRLSKQAVESAKAVKVKEVIPDVLARGRVSFKFLS